MNDPVSVPVLIVGGGIVGLSASLFLSHLGVRSLLVERHAGTAIHPRARGFNVRTMELYRELGLDDAVRKAGAELSSSGGIYRGSTLAEVIEPQKRANKTNGRRGLPTDGITKRISPVLGARATQDAVEPVLLAAARAQHLADVRFHTECTEFTQDGAGITAQIRDRGSGETSTIHAQYMIGTDGAGSPVRQKLGIGLTGIGLLGHLVNIQFQADLSELVRGREFSLCLIDRPGVRGIFASINNSDRWVFQACYDPTKGDKAEDFTIDRCKELVKMAIGLPELEVKIMTALPWECAARVVDTLQQERVFLAGDAAHQMPPWRGQGATSGIADVHNLTWKLATVLKGEAEPALLDTYDTERLPVGRLAVEGSAAATDKYGLLAKNWTFIIKILSSTGWLLGYGYRYSSSTIIQDATSQLFRFPWDFSAWLLDLNGAPGTRVPHLFVQQSGEEISTLDLCSKTFVVLAGQDGADAWKEAAARTRDVLGINLVVYGIGPSSDLLDSSNQWLSLAGISACGALLIRPDGFVAWRAYAQPNSLSERLKQIMRQVLCR